MSEANPLLSICIPTFNRPTELDSCLQRLTEECRPFHVAICVSDNASGPEVAQVVARHQAGYGHIFYRRNDSNVGMGANFIKVVELSRSTYSWLFSDDDRMAAGAVRRMLELCARPDAEDLVIVNRIFMSENLEDDVGAMAEPITQDEVIAGGGRLLVRANIPHYSFISCLCFKTRLWLETRPSRFVDIPYFSHSAIIATFMSAPERRARLTAEPFLFARIGRYSWLKHAGIVWFHYLASGVLRSEGYSNEERRRCLWDGWRHQLLFSMWLICKAGCRRESLRGILDARADYLAMKARGLWLFNMLAIILTFATPAWLWNAGRLSVRKLRTLRSGA